MADHDAGEIELLLRIDDQPVDRLRHDGIEARRRFVEQDDLRVHGDRPASPTLLRIPPLSSEGIFPSTPVRPTAWSRSATVSRISLSFIRVCSLKGKAMFSPTVIESNRAASWKSIPNFLRISFKSRSPSLVISTAVDQDFAAVRPKQTNDVFKKDTFAPPAPSDDHSRLPRFDFEIETIQDLLFSERFAEIDQFNHRLSLLKT